MPVSRRLMKPGTWSLKLRPDTPYSVFSQINQFDHVVMLPTRLEPIGGYTDAALLGAAFYSGVITKKPSATELAGHGLEWWLGTPKGYGAGTGSTQGLLTSAATQSAATLSTWVAALCPPALSVGTVTNGALPTLSDSFQFVTRREALDAVCRQIGAEYRVNANGSIDAAAAATLFGSTATVVVTNKEEGRDGPYQGLEGSLIVTASDVDEYITKAIVVTRGEGSAATATTTTGSTSYRDFAGNTTHVERYIDAPTALAANAGLIGTAAINKFNAVRRDLRLTSRTYNVSRFAEPGDYIFVYDPVQGLYDTANQIIYRGEVIVPLLLRVYGLTFPIESGMGVYVRRSTGVGTATWLDVSDWVVWEDGEVQWEVGAPRRPLIGTNPAQSEGTVAYLGVNPDVAGRANDVGAWSTWTPVVQQGANVAATVVHAAAIKEGRKVTASFRLLITGTGTAGQGVGVSLPFNAARTVGNIGYGGIFDSSAGLAYAGIADLNSVNNQLVFSGMGLGISPAALGAAHFTAALAAGDIITANLTYEAAT